MIEILKNQNFKTYLILGNESDDTWKLGQAAQNFLPGVRAYLVKSESQAEVRANFNASEDAVGIVFGRSDAVSKTLSKSEASDFLTVTETINNA